MGIFDSIKRKLGTEIKNNNGVNEEYWSKKLKKNILKNTENFTANITNIIGMTMTIGLKYSQFTQKAKNMESPNIFGKNTSQQKEFLIMDKRLA